jgi:hypothetical protein
MLNAENLSDGYWRDDARTIIYILNKGQLDINSNKTPYELWFGRSPSVKYFKVFGSKCCIKRLDKNLRKFDARCDEGIILDMLLPINHTDATILGYIKLLRVQMSRWMI